jgi:hypothetical protein
MLAHQTEHLDNASIQHRAEKWAKNKLISEQTFEEIKLKYPDPLYTPNLFIRIGLFIFTSISLSAANSFFFLVTAGFEHSSEVGIGIRLIVLGIFSLILLEGLIRDRKIHRSGIDDALLYAAVGCFVSGFCLFFSNLSLREEDFMVLFSFIALPFLIGAAIRYADTIAAVCVFICFFTIVFILVSKLGTISKMIMPFLIMILSAVSYLQITRYRPKVELRFWDTPLLILEILSLVLFYAAGNYFIVRTLSEELFNMELAEGEDIPLALLFYAYTAVIPMVYVFYGLKNKNRVLLQTGLILIAVAVITFKLYFSTGHHEISFTIGGIIMILIAWTSIQYLKIPKYGITFIEDKDEKFLEKFDAEALVIAQSFSQHGQENTGTEMGGGKFGGGGADGGF